MGTKTDLKTDSFAVNENSCFVAMEFCVWHFDLHFWKIPRELWLIQ